MIPDAWSKVATKFIKHARRPIWREEPFLGKPKDEVIDHLTK